MVQNGLLRDDMPLKRQVFDAVGCLTDSDL